MAALGLKEDRGDAGFAEVGEGGVSELVQGRAAAGLAEQLPRRLVRQSPEPGVGTSITAGRRDVGLARRDEHGASAPAVEVSGQQPSGA